MKYLYGVKCTNEDTWVYTEGYSAPTVCPNNRTHTITDVVIVKQLNVPQVIDDQADGHYICGSLLFNIDAASPESEQLLTNSWPIDCTIWTLDVNVTTDMLGDCLCIMVAKDQAIGVSTASIDVGTTVLPVNSTVLQYIKTGFYVHLVNSANPAVTEELGQCVDIDRAASTITVETATTNSYSIYSTVTIDVYMVKNLILAITGVRRLSGKGLKGKMYTKGSVTTIKYKNNNGLPKVVQCDIERFYGFE